MRRSLLLMALSLAPCAQAALTCDYVAKVALAAIDYRDQGYSLAQVMKSVDPLKDSGKFTDEELEKLRQVIKLSFLQTLSTAEIVEACLDEEKAKKK